MVMGSSRSKRHCNAWLTKKDVANSSAKYDRELAGEPVDNIEQYCGDNNNTTAGENSQNEEKIP